MKKVIVVVVLNIITLLGCFSGYAVPLEGNIIGSTGGVNSLGGIIWYSSYMEFTTPRNFSAGEQLKITLQGEAKWVYVRLLREGSDATIPTGIINKRIHVPPNGEITVQIEKSQQNIRQISVHSGRQAFGRGIALFNGKTDIISIDASFEK